MFENQYKMTKNVSCKKDATRRYKNPKVKEENEYHTILYDFFLIFQNLQKS